MISPVLQTFIEKLAADGCVSQAEVLEVRRLVYADGQVSRAEADLLFTLNERVANDDPAWGDMFAEAVCDHLTQTGEPEGHVTEEAASWLERAIGHDAVLERETELAVVLKVLERAQSVPQRLADFARVAPVIFAGVGHRIFHQIEMVGRADYSRLAKDSASLNIARLAAGAEYPLPVVFWQLSVAAGAGGGVAQIFGGVDSFRVSSAIPFALAWLVLKRKISAAWSLVLQPEFSALFDNRSAYFLAAFHAGVSYGF